MKLPHRLLQLAMLGIVAWPGFSVQAEASYSDLPSFAQVAQAFNSNANVKAAEAGVQLERSNQRKWENGNYEFNFRAGSAQRRIMSTGQTLKEWDVAIERPIRLFGKARIDAEIGAEGVNRATNALGDARHEAGRVLLRQWFAWLREQAQGKQWQQQVDILKQQAEMTDKRVKAGDAPKMELNQARAAAAQASVMLQQTRMRAQLAANDLIRQFPGLTLPEQPVFAEPLPVEQDIDYWKMRVLEHNHELGMIQAESRAQQLMARRSSADRVPDPTVGLRYSNEMGGNERVSGLYVSVPFSVGVRSANAESASRQAEIVAGREAAVRRRLEGDVYAAYTQAAAGYETWRQAHQAAAGIRQNAELVTRAYSLGEGSLSDILSARRLALESALAETMAQLDASEARYRLLLDAHQLWPLDTDESAHHVEQ